MRRSVAEYLHCTYQQPLTSSFQNEHVFEPGYDVSPDLREDSSAVSASTGCPADEHDDVERVTIIKPLVASLSSLAEGTMSLCRDPIGPVSSVLLASLFPVLVQRV